MRHGCWLGLEGRRLGEGRLHVGSRWAPRIFLEGAAAAYVMLGKNGEYLSKNSEKRVYEDLFFFWVDEVYVFFVLCVFLLGVSISLFVCWFSSQLVRQLAIADSKHHPSTSQVMYTRKSFFLKTGQSVGVVL